MCHHHLADYTYICQTSPKARQFLLHLYLGKRKLPEMIKLMSDSSNLILSARLPTQLAVSHRDAVYLLEVYLNSRVLP